MKKLSRWFLLTGCIGLILVGCQAAASPTPSQPDRSQEQPVERNPLDWLQAQPFEPAPPQWPEVITQDLPEGFEVGEIHEWTEEMESGEEVQVTMVDYFKAVEDPDVPMNRISINVEVIGCQSAEARWEYFDRIFLTDFEWSLEQIGDTQILRFHEANIDARAWISGPYLIWILGQDVEGRNPLVDTITELYMAQPPAPGPSLVDWLREQPFEPVSSVWPDVIISELPEGFEVQGPYDDIKELPSGEMIQITSLEYHWPVEGQDEMWNMIEVYVVGSQSVEARLEFLNMHMEANIDWSLDQINGAQVVHYGSYGSDEGRIWVSGPYIIWLYGYLMEPEVWFDTFVELYLAKPPVPGVGTLLDWLRDKPFEPAPSERPDLITTGLPEDFVVERTYFESGVLPSGEILQSTFVSYFVPPEEEGGELWDWVEVHLFAFGSAAGRSEFLDMLVNSGELSPERRDWGLVQVSGNQVARYERNGWDSGRIWISGPYMIKVVKIMEEHGPWVETFTELYLAQYPPE